jgi:transcriptional regulator with XRE-family HTH domain
MSTFDFKAARYRLGLTQEQLARELGISVRTVIVQENLPQPRKIYILAMERLIIDKEYGTAADRILEKLIGEQK